MYKAKEPAVVAVVAVVKVAFDVVFLKGVVVVAAAAAAAAAAVVAV